MFIDEVKYLRKISTISLGISVILLLIFVIVAIIKFVSLRKKHHVTLSWIRKKLKLKEVSIFVYTDVFTTIRNMKKLTILSRMSFLGEFINSFVLRKKIYGH